MNNPVPLTPWKEYITGDTWTHPVTGKVYPTARKLLVMKGWASNAGNTQWPHQITGLVGWARSVWAGVITSDTSLPLPLTWLEIAISVNMQAGNVIIDAIDPTNQNAGDLCLLLEYAINPDDSARQNNLPAANPSTADPTDNLVIANLGVSYDINSGDVLIVAKSAIGENAARATIGSVISLAQFFADQGAANFNFIINGAGTINASPQQILDIVPVNEYWYVLAVAPKSGFSYDSKFYLFPAGEVYLQSPDAFYGLAQYECKIAINKMPNTVSKLVGYGPALTPGKLAIGKGSTLNRIGVFITNGNKYCRKNISVVQLNATEYNGDTTAGLTPSRGALTWVTSDYETEHIGGTNNSGKDSVIVAIIDNPASPTASKCRFFYLAKTVYATSKVAISGFEIVNFATAKPNLTALLCTAY